MFSNLLLYDFLLMEFIAQYNYKSITVKGSIVFHFIYPADLLGNFLQYLACNERIQFVFVDEYSLNIRSYRDCFCCYT